MPLVVNLIVFNTAIALRRLWTSFS